MSRETGAIERRGCWQPGTQENWLGSEVNTSCSLDPDFLDSFLLEDMQNRKRQCCSFIPNTKSEVVRSGSCKLSRRARKSVRQRLPCLGFPDSRQRRQSHLTTQRKQTTQAGDTFDFTQSTSHAHLASLSQNGKITAREYTRRCRR